MSSREDQRGITPHRNTAMRSQDAEKIRQVVSLFCLFGLSGLFGCKRLTRWTI
jgi:hypothetical protein